MNPENIRNFVIIAHVDHGKSTLADRLLEVTGTIPKRLMKPQYLDQLELERERGITIKMAPVRMLWHPDRGITRTDTRNDAEEVEYILNLIDTPGHSDFSYEVSRALAAVEGAILLVDATQGVQAQTLANYENAVRANLKVIGAVNKVDAASPEQIEAALREVGELLRVDPKKISRVSGKTGHGVEEILERVVTEVPPPKSEAAFALSRALIFDSLYDEHKGIVAFVRVFTGSFTVGEGATFLATKTSFKMKEVGHFKPALTSGQSLRAGEIGYLATGIKDPGKLKIGDSVFGADLQRSEAQASLAFPGYREPQPVVFVSFYPEDPSEYDRLRQALGHLRLNDSALAFEPDMSDILGRGFKGGFLGRLHFEITAERLDREFNIATVHSFPSVAYEVKMGGTWMTVTKAGDFPDHPDEVREPMTRVEILSPQEYLGPAIQLKDLFRFSEIEVRAFGKKSIVAAKLPLADLVSDLDDKLKSVSKGFSSLSYERIGAAPADVVKMEVLVAGNPVSGLTRVVARRDAEREARSTAGKLKEFLPKQQFSQAIQVAVGGRIIARETIPAMRKDVTGYLYGGDRTRKMKLWKKQQAGKKRLKEMGERSAVKIPANIFKELLKRS